MLRSAIDALPRQPRTTRHARIHGPRGESMVARPVYRAAQQSVATSASSAIHPKRFAPGAVFTYP